MLDILQYWSVGRKIKKVSSGWYSGDAPCCIHNGETQDKRKRGGIKLTDDGWWYHCFNCNYNATFTLGRPVSLKAKQILDWIGVDKAEIFRLNLESLRQKSVDDLLYERTRIQHKPISLPEVELPDDARVITSEDTKYIKYLESRGMNYKQYPFMISPSSPGRYKNRIIVPFTNKNKIVGYTSRFLDDKKPKFLSEQHPDYVFGLDLQHPEWNYAIVTEGIFDAISINGLAVLRSQLNQKQIQQLKQLYREIIVVPDQDKPGLKLIDQAIEYNFSVSIPKWRDVGVKDVNDAVQKYGKLATLLLILKYKISSNVNNSNGLVRIAKKKLAKRLNAK